MRLNISLTKEQIEALEEIMREDLQVNRSNFIGLLIAQEKKRRERKPIGRPRKGEEADELPDENEPKTLTIPADLLPYMPFRERKNKVNAYDIAMLEARRDLKKHEYIKI